jgi:hypothetical protein
VEQSTDVPQQTGREVRVQFLFETEELFEGLRSESIKFWMTVYILYILFVLACPGGRLFAKTLRDYGG